MVREKKEFVYDFNICLMLIIFILFLNIVYSCKCILILLNYGWIIYS